MEIVVPANNKLAELWHTERLEEKQYRRLNYLVESFAEGVLLLCNTVTGELVRLTETEYVAYKLLPAKFVPELSDLIKHRFIVPIDYDENKAVKSLRQIFSRIAISNRISSYNILPTTDCNARCFYCYQSDFQHKHMSAETAHRVVEFIKQNSGDKHIHLNWFGGEPTVGAIRIDQICAELREAGFSFSSAMVSNAFLFDSKLVEKAKKLWNLTHIQITLDGTEEVYNRAKAYVGVRQSPFKKVIENIKLFLDTDIIVNIRLNLDEYNTDDLNTLIYYLDEEIENKKNLKVYVHELFDGTGFEPVYHDAEEMSAINDRKIELEQIIYKKFHDPQKITRLPELKYRFCMADDSSYLQIAPDGQLGMCEHYVYDRVVGSLESGVTNMTEVNKWKIFDDWEVCNDCPLQPFCLHLKRCPYNSNICYNATRNNKIADVKNSMLLLYKKWENDKFSISSKMTSDDKLLENC